MEKPSYYAIIPAEVRYDKDLSPNAKLLYAEITALASKNGICYATNKYFAELYNLSQRSISRLVNSLREKKYITIEVEYENDTNQIVKRVLTKLSKEYGQNCPEVWTEMSRGYGQNCLEGIDKNVQENNTRNNNTRNNNTRNNNIPPIVPQGKETKKLNEELFNKFWNVYPKKASKGNAEKWFLKNNPDETLVNKMIEKILLLKQTEQWKKNNGQFIPYPTTWLNAKGWEDEISEVIETEEEEIARLEAEIERRKANGEW